MKEKQFKPASENSAAPSKGMASVQTSNSEEKSNPDQAIEKMKGKKQQIRIGNPGLLRTMKEVDRKTF